MKHDRIRLTRFPLLFSVFLSALSATADPSPEQVVVVANLNSPDSLELANYYVRKREIPDTNLILLQTPIEEEISNHDFVETIWNPLRKELLGRGFIDGELLDRSSYDGRTEYRPFGSHFRYLLLCKGIPLKLNNQVIPNPQQILTIPPTFLTGKSSVDSELSLIVTNNLRQISHVANPLFQLADPSQSDYFNAVSVCRLDAPTFEKAKRIVDLSIEGEKTPFLEGRAYIDLYPQNPEGNTWLNNAALLLRSFGYDVDIEYTSQHWNITQRNDAPAIYLGWYQTQASGPAVSYHSGLPPGSIAGHIHSLSASTLSDKNEGWAGPLIDHGYTVTFGNVYEPYLQMTLRPDLFIESLLKGHCVGEASAFATPVLSWQNVTIADPLYVPFASAYDFDPIQALDDPATDPYSVIISINRVAQKDRKMAKDKAIDYFLGKPDVIVAYKIIDDFSDLVTPIVLNSLYDYICTKQIKNEDLVPLYLNVFDRLVEANDDRSAQIIELLEFNSADWSPVIQNLIDEKARSLNLRASQD